ncbi:MAG: hypothetical protein WBA24_20640 [Geitlerinemataceae cyanobacterium]
MQPETSNSSGVPPERNAPFESLNLDGEFRSRSTHPTTLTIFSIPMSHFDEETDEDKQIARLQIHRDLIGWMIDELEKERIQAVRTRGSNRQGDILIVGEQHITRVKEILREIQQRFNR